MSRFPPVPAPGHKAHAWGDHPSIVNGRICAGCGRVIVTPVPADKIVGGVCKPAAGPRPIMLRAARPEPSPEKLARREHMKKELAAGRGKRSFRTMICGHRGETIGSVPCGKCGKVDRPIAVAACNIFGSCTDESIGRTERQLIQIGEEMIRPTNCITCPNWVGPADWPRKTRTPKDS